MKYIFALLILSILFYCIPSNSYAESPLVMGKFESQIQGPNNIRYDEICVRDNMTDGVKCSHHLMNAKITNGNSPSIVFYTLDSPNPVCKGVKVEHADFGMYHQDFSNCYMAWCIGEGTQNIHVNFTLNDQHQIICESSNLMP